MQYSENSIGDVTGTNKREEQTARVKKKKKEEMLNSKSN